MRQIDVSTDALIQTIRDSEVYGKYRQSLEALKQNPELKRQVDGFRACSYRLQSGGCGSAESPDELEREYEALRRQPLAEAFLAAELDLCRLIQEIDIRIAAALEFE